MTPPRGGYIDYLKKPAQHNFDYEPLIKALSACRQQLVVLQKACGVRTPLYWESGAGIDVIDAVAALLPPSTEARERVTPPDELQRFQSSAY
ncbi:hypothetical protein GGD81_004600 [Rhodobium orientis]|uniref:Uncharacterized protein n=1 Tax=Rhodobium orientis TaxID=34017 RepID=A0A327JLR1_9HYPH|nr:hypothetical protein [Rhodobium orientis]MBB4305520.1 hypothetical protein [Rhodobium orientis]MBK5949117.1 hypothetical protein [Rhodobium orientis]RAI23857.1 hypothetical protein CH339_23085 [Rhodobium orientis]